jgi:hypothetical protein
MQIKILFLLVNVGRLLNMCGVQGKMRKKPKAEPIDVDAYDAGNAPLDTDDTGL